MFEVSTLYHLQTLGKLWKSLQMSTMFVCTDNEQCAKRVLEQAIVAETWQAVLPTHNDVIHYHNWIHTGQHNRYNDKNMTRTEQVRLLRATEDAVRLHSHTRAEKVQYRMYFNYTGKFFKKQPFSWCIQPVQPWNTNSCVHIESIHRLWFACESWLANHWIQYLSCSSSGVTARLEDWSPVDWQSAIASLLVYKDAT